MKNSVATTGRGTVYITNTDGHAVQVHDQEKGVLRATFSQGPGEFDTPTGIALDILGRLYVVDSGNHRVQVFTASPEHRFLYAFGRHGSGDGEFNTRDRRPGDHLRGGLRGTLESRRSTRAAPSTGVQAPPEAAPIPTRRASPSPTTASTWWTTESGGSNAFAITPASGRRRRSRGHAELA